jgi:hypothetical protein
MTTFGDMLYHLGGVPVGAQEVMLAGGNWYFCDPTHGSADGDATSPGTATNSLLVAYNKCRDGYNDGVIFIGGATAWNPTAMLTWSKNYTHLIGTNGMPGLGNRCRIVSTAATALATATVTFSGSGCHIRNVQISNETATGTASGCAIITGLRNVFEDVFFMSPASATAAAYSCKLGSAENAFVRCTFGQFTNPRTAASYSLWIHGVGNVSRNKFIDCEFLSWGYDNSHVHVLFDVDLAAVPQVTWFEGCAFNHIGTALSESINDNSTAADHRIILRGQNNIFLGVSAVGGTLTYIYHASVIGTTSGLIALAVNES